MFRPVPPRGRTRSAGSLRPGWIRSSSRKRSYRQPQGPCPAMWRRVARPKTAKIELSTTQDSAGHGIEFLEKLRITRFRSRDQGVVKSTVGTYGARLVLARKISGKARDQAFCFFDIGAEHFDDVRHGHRVVVGVPAVEVG